MKDTNLLNRDREVKYKVIDNLYNKIEMKGLVGTFVAENKNSIQLEIDKKLYWFDKRELKELKSL